MRTDCCPMKRLPLNTGVNFEKQKYQFEVQVFNLSVKKIVKEIYKKVLDINFFKKFDKYKLDLSVYVA